MHRRNLNFVTPANLRLLQASTFAAVLGCLVLGSALLTGAGRGTPGTASIADTFASASFSALPAAPDPVAPEPISDHEAMSAARGTGGDTVRYFEQNTGRAFSVTLPTRRTDTLSEQRRPGFLYARWVPRTQQVVAALQSSSGIEHVYYEHLAAEPVPVGTSLTDIAVSPDGQRLAHLRRETDDSYTLLVSGIDGSAARTVLSTRVSEPRITWRTDDELSLTSRRADRPGRDLSLVRLDGTIQVMLSNKENLEVLWSPDGTYLLYSSFAPELGTMLWLYSAATTQEVPLGIATSASKCAWHPMTLAVTCGIPAQQTLTRDVPAEYTASIDDIFTYDFAANTLMKNYAGTPSRLIGVIEPLVSSSGQYVVFTNMFDSRLYVLPLE